MPTMPDPIVKGPILKGLDKVSKKPNLNFAQILADLQSPMPLADICIKYGVIAAGGAEEQHLRTHWFNANGWWPQAQPIGPVVRKALIKAVELVRDKKLPLECYWICANMTNQGPVDVSVAASDQQITLLLLTPMPPPPVGPVVADPSIWLCTREKTGNVVIRPIKSPPF